MKKFICTMLYVVMSFGICAGFSAGAMTRIYYPDGSDRLVGHSSVETETKHGGSLTPLEQKQTAPSKPTITPEPSPSPSPAPMPEPEKTLITMYAPDGRTLDVFKSEVEAYQNVGWFTEPVVIMYAPDGRTLDVIKSEVEAYQNVGWFTEPVITVYAVDGRTLDIKKSELNAYLDVGWYKSTDDFPKNNFSGTKMVALTFDDGPSKFTPKILDCLAANNAKATFFVVGYNINPHSSVLKRAYDLGMEIGNHTMNHKNLKTLGADGVKSELKQASDAILNVTGARPTVIRPPYGNYNSTVSSVADAPLILWSIDTLDWKTRNTDSTVNAILNNVKDGSVILMHDLYSQTAEAAVRVIPELILRGYKLVTVSELAQAKGISMANGNTYSSFK